MRSWLEKKPNKFQRLDIYISIAWVCPPARTRGDQERAASSARTCVSSGDWAGCEHLAQAVCDEGVETAPLRPRRSGEREEGPYAGLLSSAAYRAHEVQSVGATAPALSLSLSPRRSGAPRFPIPPLFPVCVVRPAAAKSDPTAGVLGVIRCCGMRLPGGVRLRCAARRGGDSPRSSSGTRSGATSRTRTISPR